MSKKFLPPLFLVIFLVFNTVILKDAFAETKSSLRVGIVEKRFPFEFVSSSNRISGLVPDYWTFIANKAGATLEFSSYPSSEKALFALQNKEIDFIATWQKEVPTNYFLTKQYLQFQVFSYGFDLTNVPMNKDELKGFKIGVLSDDYVLCWALKNCEPDSLVIFKNEEELKEALQSKSVRVFLSDDVRLLEVFSKFSLINRITISDRSIASDGLYALYSESNQEYAKIIADIIPFISDSVLSDLRLKWIGNTQGYRLSWPLVFFGFFLILATVISVTIWFWNVQLQEKIKRATAELIESGKKLKLAQDFLSDILNTIHSGVFVIDSNGFLLQANEQAYLFLGLHKNIPERLHIFSANTFFSKLESVILRVAYENKSENFKRVEHGLDEYKRYYLLSLFPLDSLNGKLVVAVLEDITELEKKDHIVQRTQKMELVGRVAGGLAHDFNNIIGGILGTASLVQYNLEDKDCDIHSIRSDLAIIEKEAIRASELVKQLLSLSRKHELSIKSIVLNDIILDAVKLCRNTFDKSVNVQISMCDESAIISADSEQLEQAFLNILMNAYHACTIMRPNPESYEGDISIELKRAPYEEVAAKHADCKNPELNFWKVTIKDTGVGMDNQVKAKVFEPFFSTKEKGQGTGLGLSIVLSILEQHKAYLDLESKKGFGTSFYMYFPESYEQLEPAEKKQILDVPEYSGKVLIADDEETIRKSLVNMLENCGFTVDTAVNGKEAVTLLEANRNAYSFVILDMAMPVMTGREAFFLIKQLNPSLPIIVSSGFKDDPRVQEVLSNGKTLFLQKPYRFLNLIDLIKQLLNQNQV